MSENRINGIPKIAIWRANMIGSTSQFLVRLAPGVVRYLRSKSAIHAATAIYQLHMINKR